MFNLHKKNCYTITTLYKLLEEATDTFDCNGSLRSGTLNIKRTDGVFHRCGGFIDFCIEFNKNIKDIIKVNESFQSGKLFYVFLKEVDEDMEDTLDEKKDEFAQPDEDNDKIVTPDWDKAASLKTKDKLEEYAREFDIELDKRNKLSVMLEDFKKGFKENPK